MPDETPQLLLVKITDVGRCEPPTEWVYADTVRAPRAKGGCQAVPPRDSAIMAELLVDEGLEGKAAKAAKKKRRRRVRSMSDDFGGEAGRLSEVLLKWGELHVREYGMPRETYGAGGCGGGGRSGGGGRGQRGQRKARSKSDDFGNEHLLLRDYHGTIEGFEARKAEIRVQKSVC